MKATNILAVCAALLLTTGSDSHAQSSKKALEVANKALKTTRNHTRSIKEINAKISTLGAQGPIGPQGPQGVKGLQGENGLPGERGAQGDKGAQGIQGIQGVAGAQGAKGDKGDKGDSASDTAFTFTVNSTNANSACQEVLLDTCADANGCTVEFLIWDKTFESYSREAVRIVLEPLSNKTSRTIYFQDLVKSVNGTNGIKLQENNWQITADDFLNPPVKTPFWSAQGVVSLSNYKDKSCDGQAGNDGAPATLPGVFVIHVNPNYSATVIVKHS